VYYKYFAVVKGIFVLQLATWSDTKGREQARKRPRSTTIAMTVQPQLGNRGGTQGYESQNAQVDQGGSRRGGRPALSILAALFLSVQLGLMLAGPLAADTDPGKNYLWPPSKQSSVTDWLLVGITVVYVAATVIYVTITAAQLKEAKQFNTHMLTELGRQVTAYEKAEAAQLEVTRLESDGFDSENGRLKVRVQLENFGRVGSPRQEVVIHATIFHRRLSLRDEQEIQVPGWLYTRQVPPGRPRIYDALIVRLTPEEWQQIADGLATLNISGMLSWDNGFGNTDYHGFSFRYTREGPWLRGRAMGDYAIPNE
jgi:hypothetical protein